MKLIKTPWRSDFLNLIKDSKNKIRITSPFIKENICDDILSIKKRSSSIELITSFKLINLYSGSLDINGIEKLIDNASNVSNHSKLHSKIYIFDDKKAVITSSNLNNGGLVNNYEYGILIDDKKVVYDVISDFELLLEHEDTGTIKKSDLITVRKILAKIPIHLTLNIPKYSLQNNVEFEVVSTDITNISSSLSGWKKEVFLIANKIESQNFNLQQIYSLENHLSHIYPKNKNIKDKIRQQLQFLRDISLIEFLGNGQYKKLWKHNDGKNL
ncbi:MAG: phospholipase D-like domain-containing protein [Balneolaceae bacterium]